MAKSLLIFYHESGLPNDMNIGYGEISIECFRYHVNRKPFRRIPMILETPGGDNMFEKDKILLRNLKTQKRADIAKSENY